MSNNDNNNDSKPAEQPVCNPVTAAAIDAAFGATSPEDTQARRARLAEEAADLASLLMETFMMYLHTPQGQTGSIDGSLSGALTFLLHHCQIVLKYFDKNPTNFGFIQMSMLEAIDDLKQQIAAIQPASGGTGLVN